MTTDINTKADVGTKQEKEFLALQEKIRGVRKQYQESSSQWINMLVYGDYGTGKTTLASTCIRPVFIDSFDPGGTKTAALQPLITSGDIIVDNRWEKDSFKTPWAFKAWEEEMGKREGSGFFNHFGTYMLDSVTKWADSMMFELCKRVGRAGKNPAIQDYLTQQTTAVDCLGTMMDYPCHVLITGHVGLLKDEVSGKVETGLLLAGKLSEKVPLVFDEKYLAVTKEKSDSIEHMLQTKNDGYYKAESRMGGSKFERFEKPDIRELLRKAGRPTEDKERIVPK